MLHGGLSAALLDGAMTHCLFARGLEGLTVELKVRYHAGVEVHSECRVRAWLEEEAHGLYQLRGQLMLGIAVKVSAMGKFILRDKAPGLPITPEPA